MSAITQIGSISADRARNFIAVVLVDEQGDVIEELSNPTGFVGLIGKPFEPTKLEITVKRNDADSIDYWREFIATARSAPS